MLLAIREKVTGVVALVFVGIIALLMVVPLLYDYVSGINRADAIKINGDTISMTEFDHRVSQESRRLLQAFGDNVPDDVDVDSLVKKQTVEWFIENTLLEQASIKDGFTVADSDLKRIIMGQSEFQKNGQFDEVIYERQLSSIGINRAYYEQVTAQTEAKKQFVNGIVNSSFALPSQIEQYAKLQYQSRDFDYVTINASKLAAEQSVNESEIKVYYDNHSSEFKFSENAVAEFIHVKLDDFVKAVDVSEDDVVAEYESGLSSGRYQTPELRSARHILIGLDEGASEDVAEAKRQEALAVITRLKAGEDFATLAKELSADSGSAAQGGNLGEVVRGVMVPAFENAVYSQALNEVGQPVKTRFGFHIIRVDDVKQAQKKPLNEVRDEIKTTLRTTRAQSEYGDVLVKLTDLSEESPDSLKPVAEKLGLDLNTSEAFTRVAGEGVFANASVRKLAFSEGVLLESLNSEVFDISDKESIVLRIKTHQKTREKSFDEAKAEASKKVLEAKTQSAVDALANNMIADLKSGVSLVDLSNKQNLEFKSAEGVSRLDLKGTNPLLVRTVFSAQHPKDGSVFGVAQEVGQNKAVFALNQVNDGVLSDLSESDQNRIKNQLRGAQGNSDYASTLKSLRDAADIWVNPDLIKAP